MDRIDPLFYAQSSRINLGEETRIKATSEEATKWEEENKSPNGTCKNLRNHVLRLMNLLLQPQLRTSFPASSILPLPWAIMAICAQSRLTTVWQSILKISSDISTRSAMIIRRWGYVSTKTFNRKQKFISLTRLLCKPATNWLSSAPKLNRKRSRANNWLMKQACWIKKRPSDQ